MGSKSIEILMQMLPFSCLLSKVMFNNLFILGNNIIKMTTIVKNKEEKL